MSDGPENASCRDTFDLVHGFIIASMQGESTEDEIADFEQLLRDSPAARRLYATYLEDTIGLRGVLSGPSAVAASAAAASESLTGTRVAGRGARSRPLDSKLPETTLPESVPPKSPVLGFLGGVVDYVNHSRRLMFLFVAVMLSGWFIFQVASVLLGRWWAGDAPVADREPSQPGAPKPAGGLADVPGPVHGTAPAWVSGSVSGRWQIVAAKPNGGNPAEPEFWEIGREFVAGQQVKLVAGLGEITLRSGAKLVLTAPTEFSVMSALRTELQVGKLAARVPHSALGFTVNTPSGAVVDLGTEFGVEVTPDRKLEVQVFVGEVRVDRSAGNDDGGAGATVHVQAGQTIHVEPGKPTTLVESKESHFHRDLELNGDSIDKQTAAYLDLMRQLKPVVWLRMEGKTGDKTLHNEAGNADAKLQWDGAGDPFVKGQIGKALWLRGAQLKDSAVIPDYPKPEHDKLSVAAWVYADSRPPWAAIVCNWSPDPHLGQFHFGLRPPGINAPGIDLFIAVAQRNGEALIVGEGIAHPFPMHAWQHVAFTTDGATLRLYRQGREVGWAKQDGLLPTTTLKSLGIGSKSYDADDAAQQNDLCWWDGKLDELAVFNDTLTAEDIQKLAAVPPR